MKKIRFIKYSAVFLSTTFLLCSCLIDIKEKGKIVDVTQEPPVEVIPESKKLTLMIYMAADNDLESEAIANLKQMEHSDFGKMNVLVLLDRSEEFDRTNEDWSDTRLFKVCHDNTNSNYIISERLDCPILGLSKTEQTELNMASYTVLRNFITFAKSEYETEKYALIIWGHGTGWRYSSGCGNRAVAIDDKTNTYMSVLDEGKAVHDMNLSVIGFDTCFGGTIENLYELKNDAIYTVASPSITPSHGWDYTKLLEDLTQSEFSELEIAHIMAESSSAKTSVYDNKKLTDVFNKVESFSKTLSNSITSNEVRQEFLNKLISVNSYSYSSFPCDLFLDIYSIAELFSHSLYTSVAESAQILKTTLNDSGTTTSSQNLMMGIYFNEKTSLQTLSTQHPSSYMKNNNDTTQCSFIKDSEYWVPTINQNSNSLLDKLFYQTY